MTQPMRSARHFPDSGRADLAPSSGLLPGPMETIESLCLAIGVWPTGTGGQVIHWLEQGCPRADRERLRLGFALEIRAWELWRATTPRLCPDELRAQLAREGLWWAGSDGRPLPLS